MLLLRDGHCNATPAATMACGRATFRLWRYHSRCWQPLLAANSAVAGPTGAPLRSLHTFLQALGHSTDAVPRGTSLRCYASSPASSAAATGGDVFSKEGTSFATLGLDDRMVAALEAAGFACPTRVQVRACIAA